VTASDKKLRGEMAKLLLTFRGCEELGNRTWPRPLIAACSLAPGSERSPPGLHRCVTISSLCHLAHRRTGLFLSCRTANVGVVSAVTSSYWMRTDFLLAWTSCNGLTRQTRAASQTAGSGVMSRSSCPLHAPQHPANAPRPAARVPPDPNLRHAAPQNVLLPKSLAHPCRNSAPASYAVRVCSVRIVIHR
jgi:hypothetical protein